MLEPEADPRHFRDAMGRFATGVTVLTLSVDGEERGMTANSLTSLSLDPPLLLVCIGNRISMRGMWGQADAFVVNVLEASQRRISDVFARHGAPTVPESGVAHRESTLGPPILDGTLAYAECRIAGRYAGGDHTIVVGQVVRFALERPQAEPLIFFGGKYRGLGPPA